VNSAGGHSEDFCCLSNKLADFLEKQQVPEVPMTKPEKLAHYIASLPDFEIIEDPTAGGDHMGAVLVEAALHGGIRYETVVRPCVEALLVAYPGAKTTSEFQRILMIEGAAALLKWRPDRKIETLVDLTRFFVAEGVETVDELRDWLLAAENVPRLKSMEWCFIDDLRLRKWIVEVRIVSNQSSALVQCSWNTFAVLHDDGRSHGVNADLQSVDLLTRIVYTTACLPGFFRSQARDHASDLCFFS